MPTSRQNNDSSNNVLLSQQAASFSETNIWMRITRELSQIQKFSKLPKEHANNNTSAHCRRHIPHNTIFALAFSLSAPPPSNRGWN